MNPYWWSIARATAAKLVERTCSRCARKQRFPRTALKHPVRCHHCGATIPPDATPPPR